MSGFSRTSGLTLRWTDVMNRVLSMTCADSLRAIGLTVLATAAVAGCGGDRTSPPSAAARAELSPIALAVAGRSNTAVSVAAFGRTVAAVWTASGDETSDIYVSVSSDSGATFAVPVRVNDIEGDARASGEQAARVAVGFGNVIHVAWPAKRDAHSVIRYAGSKDGGRTFSPAVTVAGATLTGARGWQSLVLGYDGGVHVAWLDGRNAAPMTHEHGKKTSTAAHSGRQVSAPGHLPRLVEGRWRAFRTSRPAERVLLLQDGRRDVGRAGVRGVAPHLPGQPARHCRRPLDRQRCDLRRSDPRQRGRLEDRRVSRRWTSDGGGRSRRNPHRLADARCRRYAAKRASSTRRLNGEVFAPRIRLDSGEADPAHPQMASDEHTNTAVVWDERVGGTRRVVFRAVSDDVAQPPQMFAGDGVSYPVVAGAEGHWIVLWTAPSADGRSVIEGRRIPSTAKP